MKTIKIKIGGVISAEWDGKILPCKDCGAKIGYGVTRTGTIMPFDFAIGKNSHLSTCAKKK